MKVRIKEQVLEAILEAARIAYGNNREFMGFLRAENDVITEIVLPPNPQFNPTSASTRLDMKPLDPSIIGSVHSHPGIARPSQADLVFFSKFGRVHMIIGYPFRVQDVWIFGGGELEIVK
ncbi:Mov34/MPN/PAD-1 family protein [archaeon]|nr:Mov34/MPN/PAD-1 family protein [archaeon]